MIACYPVSSSLTFLPLIYIWILGKMEYDELYDEQQLIYKRTPMDFIDHLWELLSRNEREKSVFF